LLLEITIRNLAIIEMLHIEFSRGLNVLSGETGTGKSIIIDAMSLMLGSRASSDLVRSGCEKAEIEGVFLLSDEVAGALEGLLRENGLWEDSDTLILRREVSAEGRSVARVNGRAVSLSVLNAIGRHLVDIHGQGDHLSLMQVRRHIDMLDRYGELQAQRRAFAELAGRLNEVRRELRALMDDARDRARREDLLTFQIQEICGARLQRGEDERLERERHLLANAERRAEEINEAYALLSEGERGQRSALDLLGMVVEGLASLAAMDEILAPQSEMAENAYYQLEEVARALRRYRDEIEFDPQRLVEVEERLELIHRLKRKYGDTIDDVLAFGERAEAELQAVAHSDERARELREEEASLLAAMGVAAKELSSARRDAAQRLCARMEEELDSLSMGHARFYVDIRWTEAEGGVPVEGKTYAFDLTGLDRVEFVIAPNPGEEPHPLAKIASGGETSRLMLAMKTVLSDIDPVPILIFDEVDAGIGGRTGSVVGSRLASLAANHQVLCVTHLAQIASRAERHLRVTKEVEEGRTVSRVCELTADERVDELAVMLGGRATEATRRSAAELLAQVSTSPI